MEKLAFGSPAFASLLHEAGHDSPSCLWLFESTFSVYLGPQDSRVALRNLRLLSPSKGLQEPRLRMAIPWESDHMVSEADVLSCAQTLQLCPTLCDSMDCSRLLCPQDSPGKNTVMGCHSLLWGTFLTQGSSLHLLCLLHYRQILHPLSHPGSPKQIASLIFVLFNLDGNMSSKNNQNIL